MDTNQIFNIQTVFSIFLLGTIVVWYIWPKLKTKSYYEILTYLLLFSAFRYLGTSFAVPNMTDGLSPEFYSLGVKVDLFASVLAIIGALALRRNKSWGVFFAWIYTIVGSLDFIYNATILGKLAVAEHIGPLMWLMTVLGPAWMITLVVLWKVLFKPVNKNVVV